MKADSRVGVDLVASIIISMRKDYCNALESITFVYHCSTANQQGREDEMLV